jgi:hypothetical protein
MLSSLLLAAVASAACPSPTLAHAVSIPVADRNDRFFATPRTANGATLTFYTDSGGGGPFIFSDVASRLGFSGQSAPIVFACDASVPFDVMLSIVPASLRSGDPIQGGVIDGLLGGRWFDGKTWTWDYPQGQLLWRAQGDVPALAAEHEATLGFQTRAGAHTTGFARIEAGIDGERYDFLLDTGAETVVTAAAQSTGNLPSAPFGASFISKSIADRWRTRHPDWPYIADAETYSHAAMIRVAQVTVGGYAVGPAWFTIRADTNYADFMSKYTDAPVVGSLGPSVLKNFRLTVDYRAERAYFERP